MYYSNTHILSRKLTVHNSFFIKLAISKCCTLAFSVRLSNADQHKNDLQERFLVIHHFHCTKAEHHDKQHHMSVAHDSPFLNQIQCQLVSKSHGLNFFSIRDNSL